MAYFAIPWLQTMTSDHRSFKVADWQTDRVRRRNDTTIWNTRRLWKAQKQWRNVVRSKRHWSWGLAGSVKAAVRSVFFLQIEWRQSSIGWMPNRQNILPPSATFNFVQYPILRNSVRPSIAVRVSNEWRGQKRLDWASSWWKRRRRTETSTVWRRMPSERLPSPPNITPAATNVPWFYNAPARSLACPNCLYLHLYLTCSF